jgi:hypothetical protein
VLTFEPEGHIYTWNGKVVPSVTGILKPLAGYEWVNEQVLERKSAIGTAVHLATELFDRGDLVEESVHPIIKPYLDAYKRFRDETQFEPEGIELKDFNERMGYAGTLDRTGKVRATPAVIDLKATVQIHHAAGPQTAAYAQMIGQPASDRYALQLKDDGTYKLQPLKDPQDWPDFLACLAIHRRKERYAHH